MIGFKKPLPAALLGLGLCFLLTGCPYRAAVPLAAPSNPVDPRLVGSWREDSSSSSPLYTVQPEGTQEYRVLSDGDTGSTSFRAHLTLVGDQWFLNLRDSGGGPFYSLFRIDIAIDGTSFTLYPVTENITETFSKSSDLMTFVQQNQGLSFFFEKPTRYVRASASP